MLTSADVELAGRDARLPGLALLPDPEASPARLALFTAGNLLQMASEPFRLREPEWPDPVEQTLARAETIFREEFGIGVA